MGIIGKTYGYWKVIAHTKTDGRRNFYKVRCICGVEREKVSTKLGSTKSCGCMNFAGKQQHQPIIASGVRPPEPQWQPDFSSVTTGFTTKRVGAYMEIWKGSQVIDRRVIPAAERRA
jgi:hypothetical protein